MSNINWEVRNKTEREAMAKWQEHCERNAKIRETNQRAIWLDGPDSEAARAARGKTEPDYRAMWEELRAKVDAWERKAAAFGTPYNDFASGKEAAYWAVGDEMDEMLAPPDPTYTPAVRRVVAWMPASVPASELVEDPTDAYHAEAAHRLEVALNARGSCYWTWRGAVGDKHALAVQRRWALLLRHQDESKGYR